MSKKATMTDLEGLHNLVANVLAEAIESDRQEGKYNKDAMAQAIKFLKDNGIEAEITKSNEQALGDLMERLQSLPFTEDDIPYEYQS